MPELESSTPQPTSPPRWEWPAVIGVMLVAAAFRFLALNDVPPGLHHDEVIIGQIAKDILRGHFAIYFTPGYGHEPLYHYLVAGMFGAIGANAFVLRLTSAFVAMLGLAVTYRFIRLIFSPAVAMGALAWMAISLWPVFFARVGLRGITLPLLTTLTAYFLWRALFGKADRETEGQGERERGTLLVTHYSLRYSLRFILPGILLGLTLYTYQASRIFPVIFGLFLVFVFIQRWNVSRNSAKPPRCEAPLLRSAPVGWGGTQQREASPWDATRNIQYAARSTLAFFLSALVVAAPLILYLTVVNPAAESRIAGLSGPLNQLRAGDPSVVIGSTLNTLGMFTFRGDAVPIYNAGGRPVFPEVIGAALFIAGLLICLWRWKRPANMLMLLWFFLSLIPAMVTPFSPNFVRTIAAWPVPFVFVGLAMSEIVRRVGARGKTQDHLEDAARFSRPVILSSRHLVTVFFALALVWNAASTINDYFVHWPQGDYVRFWQQAIWTQAVRHLNADPASTPIAASGLSIQDFDPQTFDLLGVRPDLKVKWFDCRTAMLYPRDGAPARYLVPAYLPCGADLWARFRPDAKVSEQPRWPDSGDVLYTLYDSTPDNLPGQYLPPLAYRPMYLGGEAFKAADPLGGLENIHPPGSHVNFGGLLLWDWETNQDQVKPGDAVDLLSYWEVGEAAQPVTPPVKIFVHLTAPDGKIVAQWDGLDVGLGSLEPHDVFVERHRIELPADLPSGPYRISIGAYHSDSGARLTANVAGHDVDSIVLGTLNVQ